MLKEQSDDLAVARIYSYRHEAELARSALEAQGIEAMVEADDCGGQRPLMGANVGVKLLVRRSDESRAKDVLA
jgi:imidazoleglycerol phosphate synthase glutamine amidotransferase subunit HisH